MKRAALFPVLFRLATQFAALLALVVAVAVAPSARADEPLVKVEGLRDNQLRERIEQAVGDARSRPRDRLEAKRRAEEATEAASLVLRSEGYYDFTIAPDAVGDPPRAVLKIDPGPRFALASPAIEWQGAPPDANAIAAVTRAMALMAGQPGRAPDVVAAEGRIVGALKSLGYADAEARPRRVTADFTTDALTPVFVIASGSMVRLGPVVLSGKSRTRLKWVRRLTPWRPGEIYSPAKVTELSRRLEDAGVFQSADVTLADSSQTGPDGLRPVKVQLTDRLPLNVQVGASYSTSEGVGVNSALRVYNRLGRAETLTLSANIAQIEKLVGLQLSLPDVGRPDQTLLVEPALYFDHTDAFDDKGERLRLTLKRRLKAQSFLTFGASVDQMRDTEYAPGAGPKGVVRVVRDLVVVSGFAGLTWDRSDNPLNPKRGWRVTGDLAPTLVTEDKGVAFLRVMGQASGYLPLDRRARTLLAGRVRLGSFLSNGALDVPAPLRFYAGGGGSVRGYAYQGVGPHLPNGAPEGGAALFETTAEIRRDLVGPWSMAAFLEGGSLARSSAPDLTHVQWAAGAGVRYNMGFGPLRLDLGVPLDHVRGRPPVQVYLGLGQAF